MTLEEWHKFGQELRAVRLGQHRSLREVADAVHCSHSTIARIEAGQVAGRQEIVAALDELYGAEGRFGDIYGQLLRPRWCATTQTDRRYAKRAWQHTFPPHHDGNVWILVKPTPGQVAAPHQLELNWGPWRRRVELPRVDLSGATLVTGKSRERVAVPLRVDVAPDAHLLFGVVDERIDLAGATSIHREWQEVAQSSLLAREALATPLRRLAADSAVPSRYRSVLGSAAKVVEMLNEHVLQESVHGQDGDASL